MTTTTMMTTPTTPTTKHVLTLLAVLVSVLTVCRPASAQRSTSLQLCDPSSATPKCMVWKAPAGISADVVVQDYTPVGLGFVVNGNTVANLYSGTANGLHIYTLPSFGGVSEFANFYGGNYAPFQMEGSSFYLTSSTAGTISIDTNGVILNPTFSGNLVVKPGVTDAVSLGNSSYEWLNTYTHNLTVTGSFTCGSCTTPWLPTAGGTMTGNILASGTPNIGSGTNAFSNAYLSTIYTNVVEFFSAGFPTRSTTVEWNATLGGWSWVSNNTGDSILTVLPSGGVVLSQSGVGMAFYPAANDLDTLGISSSQEWLTVYTKNVAASNNVVASNIVQAAEFVNTGLAGGGTQCAEFNNSGIQIGTGSPCASTSGYLPTSGGTMTGSILASGTPNIGSGTNAFSNAYLSTIYTNVVDLFQTGFPSNTLTLEWNGGVGWSFVSNSTGYYILSIAPSGSVELGQPGVSMPFYPGATDLDNLGLSGNEWLHTYSKYVNVASALIVGASYPTSCSGQPSGTMVAIGWVAGVTAGTPTICP